MVNTPNLCGTWVFYRSLLAYVTSVGPSEKNMGFKVEVRKAIVSTIYIKSSYSTCFFFTLFTSAHPVNMNILHGPIISPLLQIVCSCSHLIPQHHVPLEWKTWRSADPDSLLRSGPRVWFPTGPLCWAESIMPSRNTVWLLTADGYSSWSVSLIVNVSAELVAKYFSYHAWSQHIKLGTSQTELSYFYCSQPAIHLTFLSQSMAPPSTPCPSQKLQNHFCFLLIWHLYPMVVSSHFCPGFCFYPCKALFLPFLPTARHYQFLSHTLSLLIWPRPQPPTRPGCPNSIISPFKTISHPASKFTLIKHKSYHVISNSTKMFPDFTQQKHVGIHVR